MCGKEIYKSRTDATNAVKKFRKNGKRSNQRRTHKTYFCDSCNAWHTTSNRKRGKPRTITDTIEANIKISPKHVSDNKNMKQLLIKNYSGK